MMVHKLYMDVYQDGRQPSKMYGRFNDETALVKYYVGNFVYIMQVDISLHPFVAKNGTVASEFYSSLSLFCCLLQLLD
jgi:hypothetical protein